MFFKKFQYGVSCTKTSFLKNGKLTEVPNFHFLALLERLQIKTYFLFKKNLMYLMFMYLNTLFKFSLTTDAAELS